LEEKGFGGLCRRALLAEDFFRPRISKSVRLLFIYIRAALCGMLLV
jgi:hypothetical protein